MDHQKYTSILHVCEACNFQCPTKSKMKAHLSTKKHKYNTDIEYKNKVIAERKQKRIAAIKRATIKNSVRKQCDKCGKELCKISLEQYHKNSKHCDSRQEKCFLKETDKRIKTVSDAIKHYGTNLNVNVCKMYKQHLTQ